MPSFHLKTQVFYFYEGETEKKLLEFLKNTKKISSGKVRKFNLWKGHFRKIQRTINKDDCKKNKVPLLNSYVAQ
jgi:hypothetical protein